MNEPLEILLGPHLFTFSNFENWVNTARRKWKSKGVTADETLCIDSSGRICRSGKEFKRARDENTFPVRVFMQVCE